MREGPLAALFRSTEEGKAQTGGEEPPRREEPPREEPRREEPVAEQAPPVAEEPVREEAPRPDQGSRYEGVPTPEERLRTVFSAEIPENIMDRSPEPSVARPEPVVDQEPIHQPSSPLTKDPVLRVVGVGGAGVNAVDRMIEAEIAGSSSSR